MSERAHVLVWFAEDVPAEAQSAVLEAFQTVLDDHLPEGCPHGQRPVRAVVLEPEDVE